MNSIKLFVLKVTFACFLVTFSIAEGSVDLKRDKNKGEEAFLEEGRSYCKNESSINLNFYSKKLNRDYVVNQIKNCTGVRNIIIDETYWEWNGISLEKVYTPSLTYFRANITGPIFESDEYLESLITFYNDRNNIGGFSELKNILYFITLYDNNTKEYLEMTDNSYSPSTIKLKNFHSQFSLKRIRNIMSPFLRIFIMNSVIYSQDVNFTYASFVYLNHTTINGSLLEMFKTARNVTVIEFVGDVQVINKGLLSPVLSHGFKKYNLTRIELNNATVTHEIIDLSKKCKKLSELKFEHITVIGSPLELIKIDKNIRKIQFVGEVQIRNAGTVSPIKILNNAIEKCNLVVLILKDMTVIRNEIIQLLNKCDGLSELKLENIIWIWDSSESCTKSHLPFLETYWIQQTDKGQPLNTLKDFQCLKLFYRHDPATEEQFALKDLDYSIKANFKNGMIVISKEKIFIINITQFDVTNEIHGLTASDEVVIERSKITAKKLNLVACRKLIVVDNDIIGSVGVILKSAYSEIFVRLKVDEAIDVALLQKSLSTFKCSQLSLRWSSVGPIHFKHLTRLELEKGDIDLTLFKTSDGLQLSLTDFYLWSSNLQVNDFNIQYLKFACRFKRYCQKLDLCNIPSNSIQSLDLINIEVIMGKCQTSSLKLLIMTIANIKFDYAVFNNFSIIFPRLLQIHFELMNSEYSFIPILLKNRKITSFTITIRYDMTEFDIDIFINNLKLWTDTEINKQHVTLGSCFSFWKFGNPWEYMNRTSFCKKESEIVHRRFNDILDKFKIDETAIDETTINNIVKVYPIIVYLICSFGILFNIMSAVVLFQKSMRSSTSYIMISLTFCDSLFLIACLLTTSEFKLIFVPGYNKNWIISNIVYPLQKIGYSGSIYMTILITIERYIATCYPLLCKSIFTTRNTLKYILTAIISSNILNITRWVENIELNYEKSSPIWSNWNPKQLHKFKIYEYLYLKFICYTFTYVIPFVSIIVLNSLIAIKTRKARDDRQRLRGGLQKKEDNSLTRVLLTVVIVFLICNSISGIVNWIFISHNVDPEIGETFGILPIIINSSVNFILYYLMGTKFKNEFKATWIRSFKFLKKQETQPKDSQNTSNSIPLSNF